jgi:hypothetical protein
MADVKVGGLVSFGSGGVAHGKRLATRAKNEAKR